MTKRQPPRSLGRSGHRWRRARRICLERRPLICYHCDRSIDRRIPWPLDDSPSVHHIVSMSNGGDPLDQRNLAPSHLLCNVRAGNRDDGPGTPTTGTPRRTQVHPQRTEGNRWITGETP